MEKYHKKIEQSKGNFSLLHQVFSEIEQLLTNKLVDLDKDGGKIVELRFLWDHCGHSEYAVAFEACQSVVNLTLNGFLGINESITALISNVSTARHYGLLTDSIAQLMLRGSYKGNRHPFISFYEMKPESWPYILQQTSSIISCGMFEVQALQEIKPFVIYTLCYGLYETRISLLCLLMEKLHSTKNQLIIDWLLETLLWQHSQNSEKMGNNFYLICVQHLCEYAIKQKDEELGKVMAIFLTSAMQTCHEKLGFGINHSIILIKQLNDNFALYLEPIVAMIGLFLLDCQPSCYDLILDLCLSLSKRRCSSYVWAMLQCAILSIFPYSTKIESGVIQIVESSPMSSLGANVAINTKPQDYLHYLSRTEVNIQVSIAVTELAQQLERHADNLSAFDCRLISNYSTLPKAIFLLKCAVFWRSGDVSALNDAVQFVSSSKLYANPLLTLLLKKITVPTDGKTKLTILYHLSSLAIDKTCVPRVLQIYEALSSNPQLKPVRIRLLTELWKEEDRIWPYLEKVINSDQQQTEEFLIAKASAIDIICNSRSDKYGAELLSVISDLLNSSLGKLSTSGSSTIATLSLRSLVSLCRAEVVDLKSVWDLLSPKLNQDHRPSVISEMCNLLGLTADLRIDNEAYDEFISQAIITLFRVSLTTNEPQVSCLALRALGSFPKKDFNLKCMPEASKDDLKIPVKYLTPAKTEITVKAEDVLDYVPGLCWMKLMDFYEGEALLTGYYSFLFRLIQKEIESMPIWIYRKAATDTTKKNEPTNYNSVLKEDSVLAALIVYLQRICENNAANRLRISLAFKVLAGPFERPLPPLNWRILLPVAEQYNLEPEFMEIVFSQIAHSFSAQSIAEDIIKAEPLDGKLAMVLLSHLGPLCKTVPIKSVQDFLYQLLTNQQSEILTILNRIHHSLTTAEPPICLEVKETIADILVGLFPIIPDDLETVKRFASCFRLVSGAHRPLCDPSTSTAKMSVITLLYASLESDSKTAVDYLLKALQLTLYLPCLDMEVVELLHRCVEANIKSSPNFLLQFLSYIQLTSMRSPDRDQHFSSLMDTLALIVGSCSNSLIFYHYPGNEDRSGNFREHLWEYFPLGVSRMFIQPQWITVKKNMQDWILAMLENVQVKVEQRSRLLDALPSTSGIEKETFFRVMASI